MRSVYVYSCKWCHLWIKIRSNWGWFRSSLTLSSPIVIFELTKFCTVILLFFILRLFKLVRKKIISKYQEYFRMKMILTYIRLNRWFLITAIPWNMIISSLITPVLSPFLIHSVFYTRGFMLEYTFWGVIVVPSPSSIPFGKWSFHLNSLRIFDVS